MSSRTLRSVAVLAAIAVAGGGATGVASAAKPAGMSGMSGMSAMPVVSGPAKAKVIKRNAARQLAALGVTDVTFGSGGGAVARLVGTPWDGGPGDAGKAECQALADAAQGIHDAGVANPDIQGAADALADSVLTVGQARGCVFTGGY
jgi:hypothetical protein